MTRALRLLATRFGVQIAYRSVRTGKPVHARPATLVAVLRALGAELERAADAPAALRAHEARPAPVMPPTVVAWDGALPDLSVRLPRGAGVGRVGYELSLEDGGVLRGSLGRSSRRIRIRDALPSGGHRLRVAWRGGECVTHVLAAPRRWDARGNGERRWGVFLPLYAARGEGDWGTGTLTELRDLMEWTATRRGSVVSTLPLFAAFDDDRFDPSPYAPVSRLFWNEFYLDPAAMDEFHASPEAKRILAENRDRLEALRRSPRVDWQNAMELRRRVLAVLCEEDHRRHGGVPPGLRAFARTEPDLDAYAGFRAAGDEAEARYHRWVQWRFEGTLRRIAEESRRLGVGLYLDLPLGVHGAGFDPWRWPDRFARGVAGGAPPDHYSAKGQDWGFPPLHPARVREDGHRYFRSCLARLARHAAVLRLDHVMSLHRLWWVPAGAEASEGAYVRYPAEELHAAACLEASRAGIAVVGEDLGTVPAEVRADLRRHGWHRTWAVQRALTSDPARAFSGIPTHAAASFNTHDHPTFAGWWEGTDLDDRARLGFLDGSGLRRERARRDRARKALIRCVGDGRAGPIRPALWFRRALPVLGASRADWVLVNLEDLWGERRPQNVPGTTTERPNWRRRATRTMEQITRSVVVRDTLESLDAARRGKEGP